MLAPFFLCGFTPVATAPYDKGTDEGRGKGKDLNKRSTGREMCMQKMNVVSIYKADPPSKIEIDLIKPFSSYFSSPDTCTLLV
jgi:hypothetical protein